MAYAMATPPAWVKTASAAEAWALYLTLKDNPFPPDMLTDCKALVDTVNASTQAATSPNKPNARIWKAISSVVDGRLQSLRRQLVWMPAHTSCAGIEALVKSDGRPLTVPEWRANQLADALAKRAAPLSSLAGAIIKELKVAGEALRHAAALLGVVTKRANQHPTTRVLHDGSVKV